MIKGKGVREPSYRRRVSYQAALLGGMAMLAGSALLLGNLRTRDDIAERRTEDLKASLSQVLPDQLHDNDLLADSLSLPGPAGVPVTLYRARKNGTVIGAAFEVTGQGYAGPIAIILAVDRDGRVLGTRVLAHAETPGLGDKIEVAKSSWITGFDGRSLGNPDDAGWGVKKDGGKFDQFTGATITPRAVVKAVHDGLVFFSLHRDAVIGEGTIKPEAES